MVVLWAILLQAHGVLKFDAQLYTLALVVLWGLVLIHSFVVVGVNT